MEYSDTRREVQRESLSLDKESDVRMIKMVDGRKYSIRKDRRRIFFPDEWIKFIGQFKSRRHRFFFLTLLHSGARVMEALHIKYEDIDDKRGTLNLSVIKQRKAKKNYYATGKTRRFFVATEYIKEYQKFIRGRTIYPKNYIFLNNKELPGNYEELNNDQKKKYYQKKVVAYSQLMKRKLKQAGIKDYWNFSLHNIRKTYGNWMRTFGVEMGELCYRMGHDMDTFIAHYGSSLIFTPEERRKIEKIMGDVK